MKILRLLALVVAFAPVFSCTTDERMADVKRLARALTCAQPANSEFSCSTNADCRNVGMVGDTSCAYEAECINNQCSFCISAASVTCRAATDLCDADDKCDPTKPITPTTGPWQCTADLVKTNGTVCRAAANGGGANDCDVAEVCNGSAKTCPANAFKSSSTTCRASAGVCDVAETCTGTGPNCPADGFQPSSTQCRAASGGTNTCDVAEFCTGSAAACPTDGFKTNGTVCRVAAGPCDVDDTCNGTNATCSDSKRPNGFVCLAAAGACDLDDTCDGTTNGCATKLVAAGTQCRGPGANSTCDPAEVCTGSSPTCPADGKAAAGTACGAAPTGATCDLQDTCDGSGGCVDNIKAAGVTCRTAANGCDVAEVCAGGGSKTCPADAFAPNTTNCGSGPNDSTCSGQQKCTGTSATCGAAPPAAAGTVCRAQAAEPTCDSAAEVCNGTTTGCPTNNSFKAAGTVCRAAAGVCDAPETCSGSSLNCPSDAKLNNTNVCRPTTAGADALCDPAEVCPGNSNNCPADVKRNPGDVCRGAVAGGCDIAEVCSATLTCPADAVQPAGTTCRGSAGLCDIAETCNGTANTCPSNGFAPSSQECRAAVNGCDVAEFCTGVSAACPANQFAASNVTCGNPSQGECDLQDTCLGTAATCVDRKSTAVCRPSAGLCDPAESCNGTTNTCPADVITAAGVQCRAAAGPCDIAAVCPGGSNPVCPPNAFQPSSTQCRGEKAGSLCDVAEFCTGASAACPNDGFKTNGTSCRPSAGPCDVAESCTGASPDCPNNAFLPSSNVCRAATDLCDAPESCTGSSAACPADAARPSSFVCRPATTNCDVAETCNGTSMACPPNAFANAATVCRAAAGSCDIAETCNGSDDVCPPNGFQPSSFECRGAVAGGCDVAEFCTGSNANCPANVFAANSVVCRAAAGACDVAERCTGSSATCPADASAPNNTSCDDGTVCNGVSRCQSGSCQPGTAPNCDDGNPCTADACDPVNGCTHTPVTPGTACSDGLYCTVNDVCTGTVCGGTPRNCGTPADACLESFCDEASSQCKLRPDPDGPPCKDDTTKPYMMIIVDNSVSMATSTGGGNNSCGVPKSRLADAKCVLTNIINSYGEVVFGLERFRESTSTGTGNPGNSTTCGPDCLPSASCPSGCSNCDVTSLGCGTCNPDTGAGCPATGGNADQGEVLTPIVDRTQNNILKWLDNKAVGCGPLASDVELSATTFTPIAGSLRTAKRYYAGGDPLYTTSPIDDKNPCRPYYVILLTDGNETCSTFADTVTATTELRTTTFGGKTYDIKTYVIGVGNTLDSTQIGRLNAIANAGGTGTAYLATDETALSLVFADILKKSILVEVCNGKDDNCNGLIDEGFTLYCDLKTGHTASDLCTDPGDPCDDTDDNCFAGTTDEVRNPCGLCGPTPIEVCNGIDDDCDGLIDGADGLNCTCFIQPEICDNMDNDCDGVPDNGLTRPCGTDQGACSVGVETCVAGEWVGCTANNGMPEDCNNIDDNCDGIIDGIARPCGHAAVGLCRPGTQICTAGVYGDCVGNVEPVDEICDLKDNNCNEMVDEGDPGGGSGCSTACGPGTVHCVNGKLVCVADGATLPEVCNGKDDNCNGLIDEGLDNLGECDDGGRLCIKGTSKCVGGIIQCIGGNPPQPEVCDCSDNDCSGVVDDGALCGAGASCLRAPYCQCAFPCGTGEFPCPAGFRCTDVDGSSFCTVDPCANVVCDRTSSGELQICVEGACTPICSTITCAAPLSCRPSDGACVATTCTQLPELCTGSELCIAGQCVADPCEGVNCTTGQFCREGNCIPSCADIKCNKGEICREGLCYANNCDGVACTDLQTCDPATGKCVPNECLNRDPCPMYQVCDPIDGTCSNDPCLRVVCPADQVCANGNCYAKEDPGSGVKQPDNYIAAAGGGGFGCAAGGDGVGGGAALTMLLWLVTRRRRAGGGAR